MKVGIVTWVSYCNFGSFLQAYALKYILNRLGIEAELIDDEPIIRKVNELNNGNKLKRILSNIKRDVYKIFAPLSSYVKFIKFQENRQKLFDDFKTNLLHPVPDSIKMDCYVAGSDQIWSMHNDFEWYLSHYFLSKFNGKKISYAPSMSVTDNNQNSYLLKIKAWLEDFSAISMRESNSAALLQKYLAKDIPVVLDPTLLISGKEWINNFHLSRRDEPPYCLCYLLTFNEDIMQSAMRYAKSHFMDLKVIVTSKQQMNLDEHTKVIVDPRGFLDALYNSSLLVTDSYHGSIFAILLNKSFAVYRRFNSNQHLNQNNRLSNLFSILECNKKILSPEDAIDDNVSAPVSSECLVELEKCRTNSILYLKNSLNLIDIK